VLSRLRFSPFLVQLVVTRRCNLACKYCNEFDKTLPEIPFDLLTERLRHIRALGAFAVEFTGGEPLLHTRIFDLIRFAKGLRFRRVMLLTNAFLLNEARIEGLNQAGLSDLQVSVDGIEPNAITVKVLRSMRPKLEALAARARFRVTLNTVVGSAPPVEALEVVRFARTHGFRPRVCLIHDGDGQLKLSLEEARVFQTIQRMVGWRFSESGDYRKRLIDVGHAEFKCRAGSRYLYVDEDGVVRWCSQQRAAFGVPLDSYDFAELKRQFFTGKSCNPHCTVGCVRTCSAVDVWRTQTAPA
jgi:MoaA/NifB/PqqE/SkfB family radical SAM enzyme